MFGRKKTPKEQILSSEKNKARLRNKRENLDPTSPSYERKKWKINNKIHNENVKIDIANKELKQPVTNTTTINKKTTVNTNLNYNKTESGIHIHGHYHSSNKKNK